MIRKSCIIEYLGCRFCSILELCTFQTDGLFWYTMIVIYNNIDVVMHEIDDTPKTITRLYFNY